jgi:glycerol-3-phosphate dehydrogenase
MLKKQQYFFDAVIVGAGVAGLMIANKLAGIGLHVVVLERAPTVASGPSTRNEGWLHRGSYHAASIKDRHNAVQVARRCIYGHDQIRQFAPEVIEEPDCPAYAMVGDSNKVSETISRWNEAGVSYSPFSTSKLQSLAPEADLSGIAAAFQVADLSINTRLLYRKLISKTELHDGQVWTGCDVKLDKDGVLSVQRGESNAKVLSNIVIYAIGYSARDFFKDSIDFDIPVRYWKSHLVVTPRLSHPGLFYLDPMEAAMMHHGNVSIVGLNEDAVVVGAPDNHVIHENGNNLNAAIQRLFPAWNPTSSMQVACTKVDLATKPQDARSLNIAWCEPMPNHLCVFPGKLTESPYMADAVTRMVHERLQPTRISNRPCDVFSKENQESLV